MEWKRRTFLKGTSIAVLGVGAGCLGTSNQTNSGSSPQSSETSLTSETGLAKSATTSQETSSMKTFRPAGGDTYVSLSAEVVEPPTDATVVNSSDNRIDKATPIQELIDEAIAIERTNTEGPRQATVTIEAENATEIDNALSKLPQYGDITRYYIRQGDFVIELTRVGMQEQ